MSATYNPSHTTDTDLVRFYLDDTDVSPATDALFQDEEIASVLADTGSAMATVGRLAGILVRRFGRKPVVIKAGDVQVDYKERIPAYQRLQELFDTDTGSSSLTFIPVTYTGEAVLDEYGRADCRWW